ncbi:MAG: two-component sensor histidine kinase [Alphaproteobacteria bacterium]|nr:two-component sensor histidine kinase [Alphaproteobacteria bacterium]
MSSNRRTANPATKKKTAASKSQRGAAAGPLNLNHEQLLNSLPHPVVVLDPDQYFAYANAAAEAFLATSSTMLKRQKLADIVAFGCPLLALVDQVRQSHSTVNEYGIDIVTPRLSAPKLVDVYAGPLSENHRYTVLMLQQRTMAQMIERQMTHRAAARSVSGMAGILAHEIKNPLSGIRGAAQLLEPDLSDDDRALTQLICTETERIRVLLDRMEVFGDERPLAKQPVNIHDVLDHVRQLAIAGFARNIEIIPEYDPSLPAVPANRDKLIQAFLNLVKNAAEAIGPEADNGRIVITTAYRPGVRLSVGGSGPRISLPLMIEIQDNGPGVPDAILEHMFDPFVTSKTSGTGLGLALVAKLIADHGGIIECDNEPGKTVFRVVLPMQEHPSSSRNTEAI